MSTYYGYDYGTSGTAAGNGVYVNGQYVGHTTMTNFSITGSTATGWTIAERIKTPEEIEIEEFQAELQKL